MTGIRIERDDGVVVLTMDALPRPSTVDVGLCDEMLAALADVAASAADRAVILKGAGSVFSAGGNLTCIEQTLADPARMLAPLIDRFHEVILAMRRLPVPIVASVHGAAAGAGFSIAMACDVVVAAESARFVAGYPKIGTSSDGGLTFQLARRLGAGRAIDAFLLTDSVDAATAHSWGLVQRVVAEGELAAASMEAARRLASYPAQAVKEIKALVTGTTDAGLEERLAAEKEAFMRCAVTPEFHQRVQAFIQGARKG